MGGAREAQGGEKSVFSPPLMGALAGELSVITPFFAPTSRGFWAKPALLVLFKLNIKTLKTFYSTTATDLRSFLVLPKEKFVLGGI